MNRCKFWKTSNISLKVLVLVTWKYYVLSFAVHILKENLLFSIRFVYIMRIDAGWLKVVYLNHKHLAVQVTYCIHFYKKIAFSWSKKATSDRKRERQRWSKQWNVSGAGEQSALNRTEEDEAQGEREWWNSGELFVSWESKGFPPADRQTEDITSGAGQDICHGTRSRVWWSLRLQ